MSTFTIPQESISGLPTIEFHFDGGMARAEDLAVQHLALVAALEGIER